MAAPDPLSRNAVLTAAKGFAVHFEPSLPSTSTHADMLLTAGRIVPPALVIADRQTAGRGQFDRIWHGGTRRPTGVTATFVFGCPFDTQLPLDDPHPPSHPPPRPPTPLLSGAKVRIPLHHLPLIVAVLVRRALRDFEDDVRIKWPNDLLLPGGKVAGILCERKQGCDLIGIGINVHAADDIPAGVAVASLAEHPNPPTRLAVLGGLCQAISTLPTHTLASVHDEYERHHALTGQHLEVTRPDGTMFTGLCHGIDHDGRLRVGDLAIHSGAVRVVS